MRDIRIDSICLGFIPVETYDGKLLVGFDIDKLDLFCPILQGGEIFFFLTYRFYLPRIDFDNPYSRGDEFSPKGVGKTTNCGFGCAVYRASGIWFYPCHAADVDYIAFASILPSLEDGQHRLGHVDQPSNVGGEHDMNVFF